MVFDQVRNAAYARAIRQAIARIASPGCRVLDLGAGLGIHGLLAAAAGAQEVVLLDPSPLVELSAEIAAANGVADRVRVVRQRVEEAEIDAPFDLLISVFTGNFLLTEDLLPALFAARERFLKPGGVMVPGAARMRAAPVQAPAFHAERVSCWSESTLGIGFEPIRRLAANSVHYAGAEAIDAKSLSPPGTLMELDFATARSADCRQRLEFGVDESGTCHGILGWFDLQLGDRWLSTGPEGEPTHWSLAFLPLDPPLELKAGDAIELELDRPEFGEWTWTVSWGGGRQRHSTFHGRRMNLEFLRRQKGDFVPGLDAEGQIALYVLRQMEQGLSVSAILDAVAENFPRQCERDPGLAYRVRNMIERWGRS